MKKFTSIAIKRVIFFIIIFCTVTITKAQDPTVTFDIMALPLKHDSTSGVYLAGSFNGWNPKDEKFRFEMSKDGRYEYKMKLAVGQYEYKITRGGWDKVECRKDGKPLENRIIKIEPDDAAVISNMILVMAWQDQFAEVPKQSTASKQVCILDTAFLIPQLNRTRRVWVYLPEDYCNNRQKYPVLYMHDGQNVFDNATSFSGEWGVDEFMDTTTARNCIVVAIDHGGANRLNEYNGYNHDRFGKGEGKAYAEFLVKTLRPFINKQFRTKKDRENTWVAGSSMGGLISLYAMLHYPDVFGGAGVFSPAFWTAPGIFQDIKAKGQDVKGSIYFYAGKQEGESMVPDMLKAFQEMATVSKSRMEVVIRDEGKHNEPTWRKEFPLFYTWVSKVE